MRRLLIDRDIRVSLYKDLPDRIYPYIVLSHKVSHLISPTSTGAAHWLIFNYYLLKSSGSGPPAGYPLSHMDIDSNSLRVIQIICVKKCFETTSW